MTKKLPSIFHGAPGQLHVCIPIDPPGAFLRLDIDVIMVDLQFGDFHLKEVCLELDCPAHGAKVWPWRWLEHIFWTWRRWGFWKKLMDKDKRHNNYHSLQVNNNIKQDQKIFLDPINKVCSLLNGWNMYTCAKSNGWQNIIKLYNDFAGCQLMLMYINVYHR